MSLDSINNIAQRLHQLPGSVETGIEGASDAEVENLESYAGRPLPEAYRRFLTAMGRSAGALFRGSDCLVSQPHGLHLRESAQRIIERSGADLELPTDAFVFLVHHGYQFLFFGLTQGDDPPVFRFSDGDQSSAKIAESFSNFLRSRLQNHEELVRRKEPVETTAE